EAAVIAFTEMMIGLIVAALPAFAAQNHALIRELHVDVLLLHAGHFDSEDEFLVLFGQVYLRPATVEHAGAADHRQVGTAPHVVEQAVDCPLEANCRTYRRLRHVAAAGGAG